MGFKKNLLKLCGQTDGRRALPSVSTALALSCALGILEAAAMTFGSGVFLDIMGVSKVSCISSGIQKQKTSTISLYEAKHFF